MTKGLMEKTESGVTFLVIKHGGIVQESRSPKPGFDEIQVKNPKTDQMVTKYVKRYDGVEGAVSKIEWYDTEQKYDTRYIGYKVHLDANGVPCVLDFPESSRVTSRFTKIAENIDWSKPVEFRAWKDAEDNHVLWVKQDDQSVPQKYTREHPLDCPPPIQNARGKWNYDAQTDFLHKKMTEVVIPAVEKANEWRKQETPGEATSESEDDAPEGAPESNGEKPDEKLLTRLKTALKELSEHEDWKDKSRSEILESFFDTTKWSDIENMDAKMVKTMLGKIDEINLPF